MVDLQGNTTRNHAGWPHAETSVKVTDPTGKIIHATDQGGSLNFAFDSWGNSIRTRLDLEVIQTKKSNAYGQIEELWDANSGTTKFEYNPFGELTKQTDAKNNVTEFTYDRLGRIKTRTINATDQTTYNYVVSGNGRGNVAQILRPAFHTTETYTYDVHGRPSSHLQQIQGQSFTHHYQYDPVSGNISQIQYPSDLVINYQYDAKGFLQSIAAGEKLLFSDPQINHWGQYTRYTMAKGTSGTFNTINSTTYNNYGQTTLIRSLNSAGTAINRFHYSFTYNEATGNMLSRRDHVASQQETFQYDALQRLTQFQVGTQVRTTTYASDGNILAKFDAGTYAYSGPFKNAVSAISVENSSSTNPLPSAIPKHAQTIQYTAFDQPALITENNRTLQFGYGADDMRNYSVMQAGATQNYIRYHLGSMDREISGSTVRDVHHIEGPSGTIAIIVKENGNWQYYYTFTDPLGSILYAYNESGTQQTRQSFDAWGRYRSPTNWNTYTTGAYPRPWLYRGYTGHEMLPAFNLINMNGRLYDPVSARMLSADPIINSIYNTQAYNRFSYVWNNPLKFIDPTGYVGDKPLGCYDFREKKKGDRNRTKEKITTRDGSGGGNWGALGSFFNVHSVGLGGAISYFGGMAGNFSGSGFSVHLQSGNGYQSSRSLALAGFGLNQSSSSWGIMSTPWSNDPWDYLLAQGPVFISSSAVSAKSSPRNFSPL